MRISYILVLSLLFPSCRQETVPFDAGVLQQTEPELFWAAVYHLPGGNELYEDPSFWYGQPASSFGKMLESREKELVKKRLEDRFSGRNLEVRQEYRERFLRWTETYRAVTQLVGGSSVEELLAAAYETGDYAAIFHPAFESRNINPGDFRSMDLASMLSSSESMTFINHIVTSLSALPEAAAENRLEMIRRKLE